MNNKLNNTKKASTKTKMTAVLIAIFFGLFTWIYTIKKSASKFIVALFTLLGLINIYWITSEFELYFISILFLSLFFLAVFATWLWALIDTAIKPDSFYENYPN